MTEYRHSIVELTYIFMPLLSADGVASDCENEYQ